MNEKIIEVLQKKFRARKFAKNYEKFKTALRNVQNKLICRAVIKINSENFQAYSYHRDDDMVMISAWDLNGYEKFEMKIDKRQLKQYT